MYNSVKILSSLDDDVAGIFFFSTASELAEAALLGAGAIVDSSVVSLNNDVSGTGNDSLTFSMLECVDPVDTLHYTEMRDKYFIQKITSKGL